MLGALGVCGYGLALALYSQVEVLPFGWRALYAVGIVPVLLFPIFRRRVAETGRFNDLAPHHAPVPGGLLASFQPLVELARAHPGRSKPWLERMESALRSSQPTRAAPPRPRERPRISRRSCRTRRQPPARGRRGRG